MSIMSSVLEEVQREVEAKNVVSLLFTKWYMDFQEFIFRNNVVVAATGWSIGLATKEVIEKLLNDMLLPVLAALGHVTYIKRHIAWLEKQTGSFPLKDVGVRVAKMLWSLFLWLMIIVLTFVLLEIIFNRQIIGLRSSVQEKDKPDFVKARVENAKNDRLVPVTSEDVQDIKTGLIKKKKEEAVIKLQQPNVLEEYYLHPVQVGLYQHRM